MSVSAFPADRVETVRAVASEFELHDTANAEYFEQFVDRRLAFDHHARQFFTFDGNHWHPDTVKHVLEMAIEAMRLRHREADCIADPEFRKKAMQWTLKNLDQRRLKDLLENAQSKPTIRVDGTNWDARPMLFGVQNGVVEIETQRFRPGLTFDYITKIAPVVYDPTAQCPRFVRFLAEVFAGEPDIVAYLQRCFGYGLTGLTTEQVFWIFWGLGSNGKSTLIEVLQDVLGAYAWTMPFPTATWTTAISEYQRAELPGRRFVTASEVAHRGHLHEDFVKSLTGGDTVNARQIYGRPFTFTPQAKFWLRVNDLPVIKDLTHSMWRRVKLNPFLQTFSVDATLKPALLAERSGILNWLLEGARLWQTEGLCEPSTVQAATATYRADSDTLTAFIDDRCTVAAGLSVGGRELYKAYLQWAEHLHQGRDDRLSQKAFGLRIKEQFPDIGTERKVRYSGLSLSHEQDL